MHLMPTLVRHNSKGFIGLEIALVLLISAIIGFALIQQQARAAKRDLAKVQADQVKQLAEALNSYSDLYRRQLTATGDLNVIVNGSNVNIPQGNPTATGEGTKLKPTVQNLVSLGLLPIGFLNRPVASDGQFVSRLRVEPPGCSPIADNCRIEGYVVLNSPIVTGGQNASAGQFDGDIVGDALSFMGGDGFATLRTGQSAISAGGNFPVPLDLNGNGNTTDDTISAGLIGMRVGALANRFDVGDPIANVDFCPGEARTIVWPKQTGGSAAFVQARPLNSGDPIPNQHCVAFGYSDIPAGYSFTFSDGQSPQVGTARVRCIKDPASPGNVRPDYPVDGLCD